MALERVERIARVVNANIPEHSLGLIDPAEILRTKRANCLGKAALVAAGLILERVYVSSEMSIIISQSHGLLNLKGKPWYGHVALILPGSSLLEIQTTVQEMPKSELDWSDPTAPYDPLGVRFAPKGRISGHPTPEIRQSLYFYSTHRLAEGIAAYQQGHEELQASGNTWVLADYVDAYNALER
jgi:hypothetical protein